MRILLAAAVLPAILLMRFVYKKDRIEKEPFGLLARLFFFGVLASLPSILLEVLAGWLFEAVCTTGISYAFCSAFLSAGLVEETCKYLFLWKATWNSKDFNYRYDGVVYSVCVSMGFAAIENIFYVFSNGFSTAIVRALISIPGHLAFAVAMGMYYAEAKARALYGDPVGRRQKATNALIVPVVLHGFFDFCLMSQSWLLSVLFVVFAVALDYFILRGVKKLSAEDAPLPGVPFQSYNHN